MLKSCQYCGRIHKASFDCGKKPKKVYKRITDEERTEANAVHHSRRWANKRNKIKERDNYRCQLCARGIYKTLNQYAVDDVEVHHIVPINEDVGLAYDDYNLITLCIYHHKQAERGNVSRETLQEIAKEQCDKYI